MKTIKAQLEGMPDYSLVAFTDELFALCYERSVEVILQVKVIPDDPHGFIGSFVLTRSTNNGVGLVATDASICGGSLRKCMDAVCDRIVTKMSISPLFKDCTFKDGFKDELRNEILFVWNNRIMINPQT